MADQGPTTSATSAIRRDIGPVPAPRDKTYTHTHTHTHTRTCIHMYARSRRCPSGPVGVVERARRRDRKVCGVKGMVQNSALVRGGTPRGCATGRRREERHGRAQSVVERLEVGSILARLLQRKKRRRVGRLPVRRRDPRGRRRYKSRRSKRRCHLLKLFGPLCNGREIRPAPSRPRRSSTPSARCRRHMMRASRRRQPRVRRAVPKGVCRPWSPRSVGGRRRRPSCPWRERSAPSAGSLSSQ